MVIVVTIEVRQRMHQAKKLIGLLVIVYVCTLLVLPSTDGFVSE